MHVIYISYIYCNVLANTANLLASLKSIPNITSSNFKEWKDQLSIVLGCVDLDIVLDKEKPKALLLTSMEEENIKMSY